MARKSTLLSDGQRASFQVSQDAPLGKVRGDSWPVGRPASVFKAATNADFRASKRFLSSPA